MGLGWQEMDKTLDLSTSDPIECWIKLGIHYRQHFRQHCCGNMLPQQCCPVYVEMSLVAKSEQHVARE